MNWIRSHQRSAVICGLTLLVPLLVYLNLLFGALGVRGEYVGDIKRLEPRIARLQGIMAVEEELRVASDAVQTQVTRLVYPANADLAAVSVSMQTDIRQLMAGVGLSISNSQVLPVREEEELDYVSIKLTVEGDVAALDAALAELTNYTPLVMVESLDVWPTRQRRSREEQTVQHVSASIRLVSLRSVI